MALNRAYIQKAALESLQHAEEQTIAYSSQFAYGAPPAWVVDVDEHVQSVLAVGDRDRTGFYSDRHVLGEVDHLTLIYSALKRGEPAPPIPGPRVGLGLPELGIIDVPSRRGDYGRIFDPEWRSYVLRLHHHFLLNTLVFGLVHECAHVVLGHLTRAVKTPAEVRALEVEADREALAFLGTSGLGDVPAALSIFRHLHQSERRVTDRDSLSHPYSAERLRLLAVAIREAVMDPDLIGRVKQALRALTDGESDVTFYDNRDGHSRVVRVSLASDWDGVFITGPITEPLDASERPDAQHFDSFAGVDVSYVRPVEEIVVARAHVMLFIRPSSIGYATDADTITRVIEGRVHTPPAWRFRWPDGFLRVDRIIDKDHLPAVEGESHVQRVLRTGRRRSGATRAPRRDRRAVVGRA